MRTPLLVYGLARSRIEVGELAIFDIDRERAELMASLGRELAPFPITVHPRLEPAIEGAEFVLSSIRVGGIAQRARDERIAIEHGYAGQETTGPGGFAMALRTVPAVIEHARAIEKLAPRAWLISFTNPAGLITEALHRHSAVRAIGICDTPAELFHKIGEVLGAPVECDYAGLNHLGWIRRVRAAGGDVTERLLANDSALKRLYPGDLFDPELIRALGLIPSEYLFYYYSARRALANQRRSGTTRGAEIERMNTDLVDTLRAEPADRAVTTYRDYLAARSASYMKLESASANEKAVDPFETATGYHRIAIEVMEALVADEPRTIVVNVANRGAIEDLDDDAVVEVPCAVSRTGAAPMKTGPLPESVRGLVQSMKAFERATIRAAMEPSRNLARLAMLENPLIGDWDAAGQLLEHYLTRAPR